MIKQWWHSPYFLTSLMPTNKLGDRCGTLLRIEFEDGRIGHADCHPWESLGDLPLYSQLAALQQGTLTPLLEASLSFARVDAEARAQKVSLLDTRAIPASHWLAADPSSLPQAISEGFDRIKIKGEARLPEYLERLPDGMKVRIDFNNSLTEGQFDNFLKTYAHCLEKFDFIEDPFPYHEESWRRIQRDYPVSLACDRLSERAFGKAESARVIIVKPAVQLVDHLPAGQRVVVTSYLDHPFGQTTAAYTAARLGCSELCGLNSHRVYQPNMFSESLQQKGPAFSPPSGTGFGFDDVLDRLTWLNGGGDR